MTISAILSPLPTPVLRTERLIAAATAFIGVPEHGGDNRGQMVDLFLRGVGLPPGEPWCAAFVHHVGFWSQFDPERGKSSWPLPATGACQQLADSASAHGALLARPARGDLFVLWSPKLQRFAHTGIVIDVSETTSATTSAFACTTIEGNTNDDGSSEGWKIAVRYRRFAASDPHRFIRWTVMPTVVTTREGE